VGHASVAPARERLLIGMRIARSRADSRTSHANGEDICTVIETAMCPNQQSVRFESRTKSSTLSSSPTDEHGSLASSPSRTAADGDADVGGGQARRRCTVTDHDRGCLGFSR